MMTYQNTSTPHSTAGSLASSAPVLLARRVFGAIGRGLRSFGESVMKASEASSRIHQIEALEAKSDAELAQLGIKRDGIVHHVFNDLFYT